MQVALQQAATDPVTGAIDMDLIQTGVSASERVARAQLAQEIKTLLISKCPCSEPCTRCCVGLYLAVTSVPISKTGSRDLGSPAYRVRMSTRCTAFEAVCDSILALIAG